MFDRQGAKNKLAQFFWDMVYILAVLCRAILPVLASLWSGFLIIMYMMWCADAPPLQFTSQPQSGNPLVPGSTKVLLCASDGLPHPVYKWTKEERLMSTIPAAAINTGSLKIRNIALSDAATYRCIASNHLGAIRSQPADVRITCE